MNLTSFNRSVLSILFMVAIALSSGAFLFGKSLDRATHADTVAWVYLLLALVTGVSLAVHERLPALRTCALSVPTVFLGTSFVVLDFRTRLGWLIVSGTIVAATPLIALDLFGLIRGASPSKTDGGFGIPNSPTEKWRTTDE